MTGARQRTVFLFDASALASAFEAAGFAGLNSTDCVLTRPSFVDV
jgi:hypothetical protein